MKELDYGKDYQYAHNDPSGFIPQNYLPEELTGRQFYQPVERGYEKVMAERLAFYRQQAQSDTKDKE
jgi:putative ATPase